MGERIIVHLVHGTWGRGLAVHFREGLQGFWLTRWIGGWFNIGEASEITWTHPDSAFCKGTQRFLKRLQPDLVGRCELRAFMWSGSNSIGARSLAATEFRGYLKREIASEPAARHLIVAHSHGGMVAVLALTEDESPLGSGEQLRGLLTMGAPFLSMETETRSSLKIISFGILPAALLLFALVLEGLLIFGGYRNLASWLAAMTGGFSLALSTVPWLARKEDSSIRTGASIVLDMALLGLSAAAAWFAFEGILRVVGILHPPDSLLGPLERYARLLLGFMGSAGTVCLLVLARAAGANGPPTETLVLRDTVRVAIILLAVALISLTSLWAFLTPNPAMAWFATFLLFWPVLALFATPAVLRVFPALGARSTSLWRLEAANRRIPTLPCSLRAIRLPGDEAALAIVAAQVVRSIPSAVGNIVEAIASLTRLPSWFRALLIVALVGCGAAGIAAARASGISQWALALLLGTVFGLGGASLLMVVILLGVTVALLIVFLMSAGLMAAAVGPEVVSLLPAVRVDCEPLPRCNNPAACRLTIDWRAPRLKGLRHALYTLRPVQRQVAQWIAEHAA